MRVVLQRVKRASVSVEGEVTGEIGIGFLVLLGISEDDTKEDMHWLVSRIPKVRIFEDESGRMNRSLLDVGGEVLVVSQFTLYGNLKKGNRPSFNRSACPKTAVPLYERFVAELERLLGKPVPTGRFGAMMQVDLCNDGPVTLIVDSRERGF